MKLVTAVAFLAIVSSCSSALQKFSGIADKVDKEEVAKIKTVAIVGLTVDSAKGNNSSSIKDKLMGEEDNFGMGKLVELKESKLPEQVYDLTVINLSKKANFKVLPKEKVIQNAEIKKFFEKKNATIQTGVDPLMSGYDRYEMKGMPQKYYVMRADRQDLVALAKSLGVDGLVFVTSKAHMKQSAVMGMGVGKITSEADVHLAIFGANKGDFVMNYNQRGAEVNTKDNKFMGFISENETDIQALQSINDSQEKLIQKMKTQI